MKLTGSNYYEKYSEVSDLWGINKDVVVEVINKYSIKLIEELLDDTPWDLPKYFKDRRTNEEYLNDLLEGQMMEELIVRWFISKGYNAKRAGADADGIVQRNSVKITTTADLDVEGRSVELQMARKRLQSYDVKEGKIKRALKNNTTIMFLLLKEDNYFIIDPNKHLEGAKLYPNPRYGGKMCYNFKVEKTYSMREKITWLK